MKSKLVMIIACLLIFNFTTFYNDMVSAEEEEVINVDDDGVECSDADYKNLQNALSAATSGGVIKIYPGVYNQNILDIDKTVTLQGISVDGKKPTINSGIKIEKTNCIISNLRIVRESYLAAALHIESSSCVISNNTIEDFE